MSAAGPDLDRSAAGRGAVDALLVPTAWLQPAVTWRAGDSADSVVAEWHISSWVLPVKLTVGSDGGLRSVTMARWAKPGDRPWGEYPFVAISMRKRLSMGSSSVGE